MPSPFASTITACYSRTAFNLVRLHYQYETTVDNLKQKLEQLHGVLEKTPTCDLELRHLLKVLDADIEKVLAAQVNKPEESNGLTSRAQAIAARFAAQHPELEFALRDLADTLENIGI